ncbi:MAG: zinc ABC transporter substrate-binding protein [Burkholderiaceae bacterium]|nr:zinc ABC transporter substrate-binding protein [Burkholderiaceae bacterium]
MRTAINFLLGVAALCLSGTSWALTVFVCEPEWGALVKTLYPKADVFSATHHLQDPHHIEARPSLIARLRSADLAVCTGAGLELGWLPMLQARAGNPRVQDGQPGMFYAASVVTLINPFLGVATPFSGDVHREGNPHIQADPHRLLKVSAGLRDRLVQLRPQDAQEINAAYAKFQQRFSAAIVQWERRAQNLKGRWVVTQHASFDYLWAWLEMKPLADLEPRPGTAPTPGHLDQVRQRLAQRPASAIVIAQHHDRRPAEWLARQDAARNTPLIIIPATVASMSHDALMEWFDAVITALTDQVR